MHAQNHVLYRKLNFMRISYSTEPKKLSSCGAVTLRLPCDFDRTALLQRHTFDRTQRNVTPLPTQRMRTITVAYSSIHIA